MVWRQRRHGPRFTVTGLLFQSRPINGPAIEARRRPGLEPSHRQVGLAQLHGKALCRCLANAPTDDALLTPEQYAAEKGAGAQHNCFTGQLSAIGKLHAPRLAGFDSERGDFARDLGQVALPLEQGLHRRLEPHAVGLDARPLNGTAF